MQKTGPINSAVRFGNVTPSDTTELQFKRLFVGGAGNVAVQAAGEAAVTFTGVVAGSYLDVSGHRVMLTNTTATNMVWLDW